MEYITWTRPRFEVRVDGPGERVRVLVWDATRPPASLDEPRTQVLRDGVALFQAHSFGLADVPALDLAALPDGERRIYQMPWGTGDLGHGLLWYLELQRSGPWLDWLGLSGEHGETPDFDDVSWRLRLSFEVAVASYADALSTLPELARDFQDARSSDADWSRLAASPHRGIASVLAQNPHTPDDVLVALATSDPELRWSLARRERLPAEIFGLFMDPLLWTEALVDHRDAPTSFLEDVAARGYGGLRDEARARWMKRRIDQGTADEAFGELRALLSGPGAPWGELCAALERGWEQDPQRTEALWVPYALDHTRDWEDWHMEAPPGWWVWFHGELLEEPPWPLWQLVRRIDVRSWSVSRTQWRAFAGTSHLTNVTTLRLQKLDPPMVDALARTPMPRVRKLTVLHAARDQDVHASALFEAPWFPDLEELWWFDVALSPAALTRLGERLGRPTRVLLSEDGMTESGLVGLLRGSWVEHVASLTINSHGLGFGLTELCEIPFGALRELDLSREEIDLDTLEVLLDAPWAHRLTRLNLDYNAELGDELVGALEARASRLPDLGSLGNLNYMTLSPEAHARLTRFLARRAPP